MSKGNTTERNVLAKLLNAVELPWDALDELFLALHTADPGEAGAQNVSEATYTGYTRIPVDRDSGSPAWTVSDDAGVGKAVNAALLQFPQCAGGSNTITHVSVGTLVSGAGQIIYSGALNASLSVSNLIQPQFAPGTLIITED